MLNLLSNESLTVAPAIAELPPGSLPASIEEGGRLFSRTEHGHLAGLAIPAGRSGTAARPLRSRRARMCSAAVERSRSAISPITARTSRTARPAIGALPTGGNNHQTFVSGSS